MPGGAPRRCEEDEVAWFGLLSAREPPRGSDLVYSIAREAHTLLGEHLLGETGAIEPEGRPPTPVIRNPEQAEDPLQEGGLLAPAGQRSDWHPAPASVRQLDTAMGAATAPADDPAVQEQRTHQCPTARPGPRFGDRDGHSRDRLRPPGAGAGDWDTDEPPVPDPAAVAIRKALDPTPLPTWARAQDPHDLPQQELAGELRSVLGPAPHVQRRQRDDRMRDPAHSRRGLTRYESTSSMRMDSSPGGTLLHFVRTALPAGAIGPRPGPHASIAPAGLPPAGSSASTLSRVLRGHSRGRSCRGRSAGRIARRRPLDLRRRLRQ
jgi:hypothetical protein